MDHTDRSGMKDQAGLVVLSNFPLTAAVDYKVRPVVLLASESWDSPDALLLVVSITSSPNRLLDEDTVALAHWQDYGLDKPSGVQTHRLFTTQARYLQKRLKVLSSADLLLVREKVNAFLGAGSAT